MREFFVDGCHGNNETHVHKVSSPCAPKLASLRSEEVI